MPPYGDGKRDCAVCTDLDQAQVNFPLRPRDRC